MSPSSVLLPLGYQDPAQLPKGQILIQKGNELLILYHSKIQVGVLTAILT